MGVRGRVENQEINGKSIQKSCPPTYILPPFCAEFLADRYSLITPSLLQTNKTKGFSLFRVDNLGKTRVARVGHLESPW